MKESEQYNIIGMSKDTSMPYVKKGLAVDNRNIRLTTDGENTLISITNEKSSTLTGYNIQGTIIGSAVIGNYLIYFSTRTIENNQRDCIYRIDVTKEPSNENPFIIYEDNLGFNKNYPIETITLYENEKLQKVYFTDGKNQPRMINICRNYNLDGVPNFYFDFVPELKLIEDIQIKKTSSDTGMFPPGVLQYAITYNNMYGQETNVAWVSSLYYSSPTDRGGSPDEKCSNAFQLQFNNIDTTYDYINVYSILRTTIDGEVTVKRIFSVPTKNLAVKPVDNQTSQEEGSNNTWSYDAEAYYYIIPSPNNLIASNDDGTVIGVLPLNNIQTCNIKESSLQKWPIAVNADFYVIDKDDNPTIEAIGLPRRNVNIYNIIYDAVKWPDNAKYLYISKERVPIFYNKKSNYLGLCYEYIAFYRDAGNTTTIPINNSSSYLVGPKVNSHYNDWDKYSINISNVTTSGNVAVTQGVTPVEHNFPLTINGTFTKYTLGTSNESGTLTITGDNNYTYTISNNTCVYVSNEGTPSLNHFNTSDDQRKLVIFKKETNDSNGKTFWIPVDVASNLVIGYNEEIIADKKIEIYNPTKAYYVYGGENKVGYWTEGTDTNYIAPRETPWETIEQIFSNNEIKNSIPDNFQSFGIKTEVKANGVTWKWIENKTNDDDSNTRYYKIYSGNFSGINYNVPDTLSLLTAEEGAIYNTYRAYKHFDVDEDNDVAYDDAHTIYGIHYVPEFISSDETVDKMWLSFPDAIKDILYVGSDDAINFVKITSGSSTPLISIHESFKAPKEITDEADSLIEEFNQTNTQETEFKDIDGNTVDNYKTLIDDGIVGTEVASTYLQFVGGVPSTVETMAIKNNSLFCGNLSQEVPPLITLNDTTLEDNISNLAVTFEADKDLVLSNPSGLYYSYDNQLKDSSSTITTFKTGEWYRFGIQAQDKYGRWSDVLYINDFQNNNTLDTKVDDFNVKLFSAHTTIPQSITSVLINNGYKRIRPVIVYPTINDRNIICQGILCPTVYNLQARLNNAPYAQSSWFVRPFKNNVYTLNDDSDDSTEKSIFTGTQVVYRHNAAIPDNMSDAAEIQCIVNPPSPLNINNPKTTVRERYKEYYYVDQSIVTMHSPDIEYDTNIANFDLSELKVRVVGYTPITGFSSDIDIQTKSATQFYTNGKLERIAANAFGFNKYKIGVSNISLLGGNSRCTGPFWADGLSFIKNMGQEEEKLSLIAYAVYPWHRQGSLNNDTKTIKVDGSGAGQLTSELDKKKMTNNRFSSNTKYLNTKTEILLDDIKYFQSDEVTNTRLKNTGSIPLINYYGNFQGVSSISTFVDDDKVIHNSNGYPIAIAGSYSKAVYENGGITGTNDSVVDEYFVWRSRSVKSVDRSGISGQLGSHTKEEDDVAKWKFTIDPVGGSYLLISCMVRPLKLNEFTPSKDKTYSEDLRSTFIKIMNTYGAGVDFGNRGFHKYRDGGFRTGQEYLITVNGENVTYYMGALNKDMIPTNNGYYYKVSDGWCQFIVKTKINKFKNEKDQDFARAIFAENVLRKVLWKDILSENNISNEQQMGSGYRTLLGYNTTQYYGTEPISINYKSNAHIVCNLKSEINGLVLNGYKKYILPHIGYDMSYMDEKGNNIEEVTYETGTTVNEDNITEYISTKIEGDTPKYSYLLLAELYRDSVPNRFGGKNKKAIELNRWLVGGEAVTINTEGDTKIRWTEGDTYYQRYDNIHTYPFTLEDQNSMTDIVSFMCETHVNIDGRYDKNRGLENTLAMSPKNFGVINEIYSQQNNVFNYASLNRDRITLTKFPMSFTWTLTKVLGEEIDTFTKLDYASIINLDGDKGPISKLVMMNDNLLAFQTTGLSRILYNEQLSVTATEGVPVQLANSNKVTGYQYISNIIGTDKKRTVSVAPDGVYFVDSADNIRMFGEKGLMNVSTDLGMESYAKKGEIIASRYDKTINEVVFMTGTETLSYSLDLHQFTSFYSYPGKWLDIVDNKSFMPKDNGNLSEIYTLRTSDNYNELMGENQQWWTEFVANPKFTLDKIFDNIEFRGDLYDNSSEEYTHNQCPITRLDVSTEYQYGTTATNKYKYFNESPSFKKKFRIWRAAVPRDEANGRDRIRNTWAKFKLIGNVNVNNYFKGIIHDIIIHYFI